ncbi:hypothetical protein ACIBKY_51300 [Nonomuraea sp. NPDC050394]|uniref:hypothetical protein n=1 Tax=Nonomuraea sp. NPDC050394 TaxID=3364363 RepID=UPI0037B8875F
MVTSASDWVSTFYDDPAQAQSMCDLLMSVHPGWVIWRGPDRWWRARRRCWPGHALDWTSTRAGVLNYCIHLDEATRVTAAAGPAREPHAWTARGCRDEVR